MSGLMGHFFSFLIKIYQRFFLLTVFQALVRPLFNVDCKFYPSCSNYSLEAVKKFGWRKGGWLSLKRLVKCHPWSKGGVDFVA